MDSVMRRTKQFFCKQIIIGVLICFIVSACSTHYSAISAIYRAKTTVWELGDTGWKISLWGLNDDKRWFELWPSVPLCHEGSTWVLNDDSLIFIGWAKRPRSSGERRLLMSSAASPSIDITDRVIAYALKEKLIPPQASLGQNFDFDGLKRAGTGIVVIAVATRGGAGFDLPISIPIAVPIRASK